MAATLIGNAPSGALRSLAGTSVTAYLMMLLEVTITVIVISYLVAGCVQLYRLLKPQVLEFVAGIRQVN